MSKRRDTFLVDPPCEEQPINGRPLMIGRGRRLTARQQVGSSGIAGQAIEAGHLGRGVFDLLAGGGYEGEATFDGARTVTIDGTSYAPSGAVYQVTNDVSLSTLTISGARVRAPGVRVFARTIRMIGSALLDANGSTGDDGSGATGASAKSGVSGITVGGSGSGGGGAGTGGSVGVNDAVAGANGSATTVALGGAGGDGGDGASSTNPGAAGGNGATASTACRATTYAWDNITRLMQGSNFITGGQGGGQGGGGGSSGAATGGGGGAGGAGGGVLLVVCDVLDISAWTNDGVSRISANGGNGGNGAVTAAGDGGVGGGGGGGFVQLVYRELIGSRATLDALVTASGGGYGQTGNQTGATVGNAGTVRIRCLADTFVPSSEIPAFSQTPRPVAKRRLHAGHIQAMRTRFPLE